jgi:Mg-chelatase subunit ChlD
MFTDITVILDRSGSMGSCVDDTIGGFNTFLKDQQEQAGKANLSLVQFNHGYELVYNGTPIKNAPKLDTKNYVPMGSTALLDAMGKTITDVGARLKAMPMSERPQNVLFVIITDGLENASHQYNRNQVFDMVKHQQDVYKWQFLYLGANQDAIAVGITMGIPMASAGTYDADNLVATYAVASIATTGLRSTGMPIGLTEEQRKKMVTQK